MIKNCLKPSKTSERNFELSITEIIENSNDKCGRNEKLLLKITMEKAREHSKYPSLRILASPEWFEGMAQILSRRIITEREINDEK